MGNNKKTVKCSFCNKLGHNRVSCEKLKEEVESNRKQHGSNHPDVRKYDDYVDSYSIKSKINAKSKRFCKYCRKPNHNSRTCPSKQQDVTSLKKRNNSWRRLILNMLREKGIGVGCILANSHSSFFGSRAEHPTKGDKWVLTTIYWEKISWLSTSLHMADKVFKLINLNNSSVSTVLSVSQMLENPSEEDNKRMDYTWKVISKTEELSPPDQWNTIDDMPFNLMCMSLFDNACTNKRQFDAFSWKMLKNKPLYLITDREEISTEILESIIKEKEGNYDEE